MLCACNATVEDQHFIRTHTFPASKRMLCSLPTPILGYIHYPLPDIFLRGQM